MNQHTKLTFWIIWFAILIGMMTLPFIVNGDLPSGPNEEQPTLFNYLYVFQGFVISVIVRWGILPRKKTREQLLTCMVVGLAFAEGTGILGLFATEDQFAELQFSAYIFALLGIIQFAPINYPKEETSMS